MTTRDFATEIVRQLVAAGFTAYWAGGCVRDLLRGQIPDDYDIATSATPDQVRQLFGKKRTLAVGESFGVIIVLGPRNTGLQVEVATFRTEGVYLDGRRPTSVAFCSPEEDAFRRDFTINGMFFDPLSQTVHDFVGGQEDLRQQRIRAIGDPRARIAEDKLRMLRGVRFTANLGFELDPLTAAAIAQMSSQVVLVSAERIAQELRKMLSHRQRARALSLLQQLNLLALLLPEVEERVRTLGDQAWERLLRLMDTLGEASFELAMGGLHRGIPSQPEKRQTPLVHHGTVQAACRRLKLSNREIERITWLVEQEPTLESVPAMSLAARKRLCIEPGLDDLLQLEDALHSIADNRAEPSQMAADSRPANPMAIIRQFRESTPPSRLDPPELLTGTDLIQLGHTPGPMFKIWLTAIRDAQLNEQICTREEAITLLQDLVAAGPTNPTIESGE